MIGGRRVLAGEHNVAGRRGRGLHHSGDGVGPCQRPGAPDRRRHVESPAMGQVGARGAFRRGERTAGARIDRSLVALWGAGAGGDFGARAEAGIDEPRFPQPIERGGVAREAGRLADGGPVPADAQPRQVFLDPGDERVAAGGRDRYPRFAAGTGRRRHGRDRAPAKPRRRGRGGAARSGWGRSGRRSS